MNLPNNLQYTKDHEWININNDVATIGITDYAQSELGDIIFIEFPNIGDELHSQDTMGTIEAVKTVADLFAPIDGTIIEINKLLEDCPENINNDPYDSGWIVKIKMHNKNTSHLLNSDEYHKII